MKVILFTIIVNFLTLIFYPIAMHRAKLGKGPWLLFAIGAVPTFLLHMGNAYAANFNVGTVTALVFFVAFTVLTIVVSVRRRREYAEDDAE